MRHLRCPRVGCADTVAKSSEGPDTPSRVLTAIGSCSVDLGEGAGSVALTDDTRVVTGGLDRTPPQDIAAEQGVLESMREQGIQPTFHYVPLHSAPAAEKFAARPTTPG
jgi:hypothetical protein